LTAVLVFRGVLELVIEPVVVRETEVEPLLVGLLEGLLLCRVDWLEVRVTIRLFVFIGDKLYVTVFVKKLEADTVLVLKVVRVAVITAVTLYDSIADTEDASVRAADGVEA
jgi:hypothetical protein